MVEVFAPSDLSKALDILKEGDVTIFAGGTDIMVKKRKWSGVSPNIGEKILNIDNLVELKKVVFQDDEVIIGAGVTLTEIQNNSSLPNILRESARGMASPAIRNIATIGGNVVNASPAGDMLPPLYALHAKLKILSYKEERIVPIDYFIQGPGKPMIKKDELLVSIIIPKVKVKDSFYKKVGTRKSIALSKASFVGVLYEDSSKQERIGIAFGSVGPRVVFARSLEAELLKLIYDFDLTGEEMDWIAENIVNLYSDYIQPISDQRSTALYRKTVCVRLLERFIESIFR